MADLGRLEAIRKQKWERTQAERRAESAEKVEVAGFTAKATEEPCPMCGERPSKGRVEFNNGPTVVLPCPPCYSSVRNVSQVPERARIPTRLPEDVFQGEVWASACKHWRKDAKDEVLAREYWRELRDLTAGEFEKAIGRAIALHEFMPNAGVVRQLARHGGRAA